MANLTVDIAVELAFRAHQGQFRKDGINPYIVHPMEVMQTIWSWGIRNPNVLAGAVLHDTLEDTKLSAKEIEAAFDEDGSPILELVQELTYQEADWCWMEKAAKAYAKQEYMESFKVKSVAALVVKVADRICNVNAYIVTGERYATKYYGKAEVLWEALRDRHNDIMLEFGQPVLHNVSKAHAGLLSRLP